MKKMLRRGITIATFSIFFMIAPLVIFYALGYRAGFSSIVPEPVGVLSVESVPTRADVAIDGKYVGRSPKIVSSLPAGFVNVLVSKDGYRNWQKELLIESGRATEALNIILFPHNLVPKALVPGVSVFSLSPNRRLLAYATHDNHLGIIDQSGQPVIEPLPLPQPATSLLWSPNDAYILITSNSNHRYLFNISSPTQIAPQPLPTDLKKIVWDSHTPGRTIWQSHNNILNAFQVSNSAKAILINTIHTFATSSRHLYVITEDNILHAYTFQGEPNSIQIPSLPGQTDTLHATPGGRLAVTLTDGSLWIWTGHGNWQKISDKTQHFSWSPDEQLILVQPDSNSLYVYNLDAERSGIAMQELHLITRLTRPIHNPQWFAGSRHLIYQVDDEIWVLEIDTRGLSHTHQLDTTNNGSSQITVGEIGRVIYYLRESGDQSVLTAASLIVDNTI
jgi:hypothetical protein